MTPSTPREPWDDERVGAAFEALAVAHPTPAGLAASTFDTIQTGREPGAHGWRRLGPAIAAAALMIVGVGAGVAVIGSSPTEPRASNPGVATAGPSDVVDATNPAPTNSESAAHVFGLSVSSVSDAIEVRDGGDNDREIAVRGWFSPTAPVPCPYTPSLSPVQPVCPDQYVVLMAEPESLVTVEPDGFNGGLPSGSAFQVDLDDLDSGWQPRLPELGPANPVEIVVIGHFDDRRSEWCPIAEAQACRDRFVVDRVDSVKGATQPLSLVDEFDDDEVSTLDEVRAIVEIEAPQSPILSMAVVDGPTGIGRVEPSLGNGQGRLVAQRAIWMARVLEDDRAVTYLVVDGSDAIFEMNAEGRPVGVGGSLPGPSAVPWPPDGAVVVGLTSQVGAGRPPARVAVVDRSGWLTAVREPGPDDPAILDTLGSGPVALLPDRLVPGRFRLVWTGGVCDGEMTVTIEPRVGRIVVDGGVQPPCDAMGIGRELVLDFSEPVDPATVDLRYVETRTPE